MNDHPSHQPAAHSPSGPFDTERQAIAAVRHILDSPAATGAWGTGNHQLLENACLGAGVELGAYDHRILLWLSTFEPQACAVIASLITRAHESGRADRDGVAQPGGGGWISGPCR